MKKIITILLIGFVFGIAGCQKDMPEERQKSLILGPETLPPLGWIQYCNEHKDDPMCVDKEYYNNND